MPLALCFYAATAYLGAIWFAPSQSRAQDSAASPIPAPSSPSAAPSPNTNTTWAVRIAPGSRCEGSQWFTDAVAAQIPVAQRAPLEQAELVAEVSLGQTGIATIHVFDRLLQAEAGSRELQLDTRSCAESAEAVSLVLAVLVEAGRGALNTTSATAPTLPRPPPPPPAPPPARAVDPAPPPRKVVRHAWLGPRAGHDLLVAVGVSGGLIPGPALGGTVGWGIRGAKTWPIWLEVSGFQKQDSREVPARFKTLYGSLLGCPLSAGWARLRARACAGGALGAVWGEGRRLASNYQRTNPVVLLGVELAASVRLVGPLEFALLARGDASLYRTEAYYDGANGTRPRIYEPSVLSGSLFTALALRFR